MLAARGAAGPELTHDPALALLGALSADVDTPGTRRCGSPLRQAPAWPGRGERAAAWLRAAVAGGVVAGLASVTSLIATSMLARLARGPARAGRWDRRAARRRRAR